MKVESITFIACGVFLALAGVIYIIMTEPEPAGSAALILCGTLCLMIGGYFWFVSRRIDPRPEDRPDAEMHEGAGELGFFAAGSYFPFTMACCAVIVGIGLAFWYPWLIGTGIVFLILAITGLVLEFYTGQNKHGYDEYSANAHAESQHH